MYNIDLTKHYLSSNKKIFDKTSYENSFPVFFKHYNEYWSTEDTPYKNMSIKEIGFSKNLITSTLKEYFKLCRDANLAIIDTVSNIIFVGKESTDGHGFLNEGKSYAFYPIERYTNLAFTKVFVLHELIHSIHYKLSPEFYYSNHLQKEHFGRNLMVEGIATFVTKKLLNIDTKEALWSNYLKTEEKNSWIIMCKNNSKFLANYSIEYFNKSDSKLSLFYYNRDLESIKNRTGYWLGYIIIERIYRKENYTILDLLSIKRDELEKLFQEELKK